MTTIQRQRRLVVIPARAGSKRLVQKHERLILGKPMIEYTFDVARELLASNDVDEVCFSTDSPELAKMSLQATIPLALNQLRPAHLSGDCVPSIDVLRWILSSGLSEAERANTLVILLQPTSPLRTAAHVRDALSLLEEAPLGYGLVSVAPCKPIHWQGALFGPTQRFEACSSCISISPKTCSNHPEQDSAPQTSQQVALNGAIYMANAQALMQHSFLELPQIGYLMPSEVSVDIDTESDLALVEALLHSRQTWLTKTPHQVLSDRTQRVRKMTQQLCGLSGRGVLVASRSKRDPLERSAP